MVKQNIAALLFMDDIKAKGGKSIRKARIICIKDLLVSREFINIPQHKSANRTAIDKLTIVFIY